MKRLISCEIKVEEDGIIKTVRVNPSSVYSFEINYDREIHKQNPPLGSVPYVSYLTYDDIFEFSCKFNDVEDTTVWVE